MNTLVGVTDPKVLREKIEAMCAPFGSVKNIRIVQNANYRENLCFVELDPPSLHPLIIKNIGGTRFGNCVVFIVPFYK